jgi:hypothetical protein
MMWNNWQAGACVCVSSSSGITISGATLWKPLVVIWSTRLLSAISLPGDVSETVKAVSDINTFVTNCVKEFNDGAALALEHNPNPKFGAWPTSLPPCINVGLKAISRSGNATKSPSRRGKSMV